MNRQSETAGQPRQGACDRASLRDGGEHEGWRPDDEWDAGDMG